MPCCYIIKCNCDKIYVGSTLRRLKAREGEHRSECFNKKRQSYNSPAYKHFRGCGMTKWDLRCEKIIDTTEDDSRLVEAKWIRHIGSLNSKLSIEDLEKNEARKQKYRAEGKIKQVCPCGGCWTYKHKARHYKTKKHQEWLEEEHQKKIKYLNSINAAKEEAKVQIKSVPLHYEASKNIFIKEGDGVQNPQGGQGLHD